MRYEPTPLRTDGVELPDGLTDLTEFLARHIHETWARGRLEEGWRYGPRRDDEAKTHPCLVPYAELSESEKEYDRRTALEAIRATLALGFRIVPPDPSGGPEADGAGRGAVTETGGGARSP
ncbi:MAG TPA: RyR domain-containing protein [Longimicrobiales bacterium]|nr:RyR domain-containing protein [Longimicrobiales bacterium]